MKVLKVISILVLAFMILVGICLLGNWATTKTPSANRTITAYINFWGVPYEADIAYYKRLSSGWMKICTTDGYIYWANEMNVIIIEE